MGCRTVFALHKIEVFSHKNWALDIPAKKDGKIEIFDDYAVVKNGNIYAVVTDFGRISFYNEKG